MPIAMKLPVVEVTQGHMTNIQGLRPCIFCNGNHYNDECGKFSTLSEQKGRLNQQGRCFVCLGHVLKHCPNLHKRACHHHTVADIDGFLGFREAPF